MTDFETRAKYFAHGAHYAVNQKRKYTGDDYIIHPAAVVEIVRSVPHTEEMLAAAWLHDVVEDTAVLIEDIYWMFGTEVALLVEQLTDVSKPYDGNRAERKEIDRAHTAAASREAKIIKLADLIDNTSSIVEHDPKFAKVYLEEKKLLLDVLTKSNSDLWMRASKQCKGRAA